MASELASMDARFERGMDYRKYRVTDTDRPLTTVTLAADRMGVTAETVRRRIRDGLLPARRENDEYNPRYLVPLWAVEGWVASDPSRSYHDLREPASTDTPASHGQSPVDVQFARRSLGAGARTTREAELERALVVLRAANEHERRSRQLLEEALAEASRANDLLAEAVGSVIIPDAPPGSGKQ